MSDLPSRELAAVIAAPYKGKPGEIEHFYKIIDAYASGRLVDREAIDREWVYGWIEAGFSEFLVGAEEHDEEYAKLDELRAALGVET